MDKGIAESGAATCLRGFVNYFPRVLQVLGLQGSCRAARATASEGNFKKTCCKTLLTCSCRPRLYLEPASASGIVQTSSAQFSSKWRASDGSRAGCATRAQLPPLETGTGQFWRRRRGHFAARRKREEINKLENETESETADGPSDCCGFWKCRPLLTFRGRSAGL